MAQPGSNITLRSAQEADLPFINSLSASLAAGAKFNWHEEAAVQKFQDEYIAEMMAETSVPALTLIAEKDGTRAGFIHARTHQDDITGEDCGTVPLLAVSEAAQGTGTGRLLMDAAEDWSKAQGYRLLHLEVFSTNDQALGFYENLGFQAETITMIKSLN